MLASKFFRLGVAWLALAWGCSEPEGGDEREPDPSAERDGAEGEAEQPALRGGAEAEDSPRREAGGPAAAEEAVATWEAWESAVASGSPERVAELYGDEAELELGRGTSIRAPARIERYFELAFEGIPDLSRRTEVVLAREGEVAALSRVSGTHAGEVLGAPATGAELARTELSLVSVQEGGLVDRQVIRADRLNWQAQMDRRDIEAGKPGATWDAQEAPGLGEPFLAGRASRATERGSQAALRRFLEALGEGEPGAVAEAFAADGALYDAAAAAELRGRRAIAGHASRAFAAFPDLDVRASEVWAAGSGAVARFAMSGTHGGMWRRAREPASGAEFEVPGAAVVLANEQGEVERAWLLYDGLSILRAIERAQSAE